MAPKLWLASGQLGNRLREARVYPSQHQKWQAHAETSDVDNKTLYPNAWEDQRSLLGDN